MSWWDDPSDPMYKATVATGTPAAWAVRQGGQPATDPPSGTERFNNIASWMTGGAQAHLFPYGSMRVVASAPDEFRNLVKTQSIIDYLRNKLPGIGRLEDKFDYLVRGKSEGWKDPQLAALSNYSTQSPSPGMPVKILLGPDMMAGQVEEAAPVLLHEMLHPHVSLLKRFPLRQIADQGNQDLPFQYLKDSVYSPGLYVGNKNKLEELAVLLMEMNTAKRRLGRQNWPW